MVTWLRNSSAGQNGDKLIKYYSSPAKNLIKWLFPPENAQNAYQAEEFVLAMNHFSRQMVPLGLNPSFKTFSKTHNQQGNKV